MDALALLASLYGDGPRTLRLLRAAGHTTLDGIAALPAPELASLLHLAPAAAARFKREAATLSERLGAEAEIESPAEDGDGASEASADGAQSMIERVLETWRERDARAADEAAPATEVAATAEVRAPVRGVETRSRHALSAAHGIDTDLLRALASYGVTTLEELVLVDADVLSLAASIPLTRVLRARFLAQRELDKSRGSPAVHALPVPGPGAAATTAATALPSADLDPRDWGRFGSPARSWRFSPSGMPFPSPEGSLASDLDRAARRPTAPVATPAPVPAPAPAPVAGPFA
jgi:hypothetical protein